MLGRNVSGKGRLLTVNASGCLTSDADSPTKATSRKLVRLHVTLETALCLAVNTKALHYA